MTTVSGTRARIGRYRWGICALLFFATTINYIDRQVLGILAPDLQKEIGWSEAQYGAIISWFTVAYAIGLLFAGRIMDRIGVRRGFAIAIVTWSCAAMSHALARTAAAFAAARFALGLCESGNFPASISACRATRRASSSCRRPSKARASDATKASASGVRISS